MIAAVRRPLLLSLMAVVVLVLVGVPAHESSTAATRSFTGFRHPGDLRAARVTLRSYRDSARSFSCTKHGINVSGRGQSSYETCTVVGRFAGASASYTCRFEFYRGLRFPGGQCRHGADIQVFGAVKSASEL
jgi:hypothetical protein